MFRIVHCTTAIQRPDDVIIFPKTVYEAHSGSQSTIRYAEMRVNECISICVCVRRVPSAQQTSKIFCISFNDVDVSTVSNVWPFSPLRLLLYAGDHSFYDNRNWFSNKFLMAVDCVGVEYKHLMAQVEKRRIFPLSQKTKTRKRKTSKKRKSQSFYDLFGFLLLLRSR